MSSKNIPETSRFVGICKGEKTIKLVISIKQSKLLQAKTKRVIRDLGFDGMLMISVN